MRPIAPVPHVTRVTSGDINLYDPGRRARLPRWLGRLGETLLLPFAVLALVFSMTLMPSPGTVIMTTTRPGPSVLESAPGATIFIVGQTERGSVTAPTLVRSLTDARAKLGPYVTYGQVDDALSIIFGEVGAGVKVYVQRIAGTTPTTGFLMLLDRAGGGGVATLKAWALTPGAYSTRIKIQVLDGSLANTFRIVVLYDDVQVEDWNNLTTPANAEQVINYSEANKNGSAWITVTNQNSVTVAPNNNPAVVAATALSAGSDDRGTIVAGNYTAALAKFDQKLGDGVVIIPGQTAANVAAGMRTHLAANWRLGLVAPASGQTIAQAKTAAIAQRGTGGFQEGLGICYPWVYVPDGAGGRRLAPPEAFVAAMRARAHLQVGPWQAGAGDLSISNGYIVGTETTVVGVPDVQLTEQDMVDLNAECVIPIYNPGNGLQVYGWRSLSTDTANYALLTGRDVLNRLAVGIKRRTDALVFKNIDAGSSSRLLSKLETEIRAEVEPMYKKGAFAPGPKDATGTPSDIGYLIDTGPGVNTDATLQANEAWADVAVRPTGSAVTIRVNIAKVGIGTALAA